ncbi:MAG: hypothetical protein NVS1B10_04360 [Candidatus Saccharimonadales bacterium]
MNLTETQSLDQGSIAYNTLDNSPDNKFLSGHIMNTKLGKSFVALITTIGLNLSYSTAEAVKLVSADNKDVAPLQQIYDQAYLPTRAGHLNVYQSMCSAPGGDTNKYCSSE